MNYPLPKANKKVDKYLTRIRRILNVLPVVLIIYSSMELQYYIDRHNHFNIWFWSIDIAFWIMMLFFNQSLDRKLAVIDAEEALMDEIIERVNKVNK
jgi:hypothetical protein